MGGGVEAGSGHGLLGAELLAEVHGRVEVVLVNRVVEVALLDELGDEVLAVAPEGGGDPLGVPVRLGEGAALEGGRVACLDGAVGVRDLDVPCVGREGLELAAEADSVGLRALDDAAVPDDALAGEKVVRAVGDADAVARLVGSGGGLHEPREFARALDAQRGFLSR